MKMNMFNYILHKKRFINKNKQLELHHMILKQLILKLMMNKLSKYIHIIYHITI